MIKDRRVKNILPPKYLVLDEASMATTEVFGASGVAGFVKNDISDYIQAFGGINVILVGDLHQFPLSRHKDLALFKWKQPTTNAAIGHTIFEQFDTVVILKEQMCI